MKSSDIKIGEEYAWERRNVDWDAGCAERVKVISEKEWSYGPSWARKNQKGFRVLLLDRPDPGVVYINATARELRATWADFAERKSRIDALNREAAEKEFNQNVRAYSDLAQIDRAIRRIDPTRETTKLEFYTEREMAAAQAGGWNTIGGYTYVAMDVGLKSWATRFFRPRFEVSRRDVGLLAMHVLLDQGQ